MELSEWLAWVVGSGGAGLIAYWLMERLPIDAWSSEAKRYLSVLLPVVIIWLAFAAGVGLGYRVNPGGAQAWLEALFAVAFPAFGTGQVVHGRLKLRGK